MNTLIAFYNPKLTNLMLTLDNGKYGYHPRGANLDWAGGEQ